MSLFYLEAKEKKLLIIAAFIRVIVWLLAFTADSVLPDHEQSADILLKSDDSEEYSVIAKLFKCFVRWDALFYVSIAKDGYLYLKNHAFFPLFPLTIRYFKRVLELLPFQISNIDGIILSGVILNFMYHLAAVLFFYR